MKQFAYSKYKRFIFLLAIVIIAVVIAVYLINNTKKNEEEAKIRDTPVASIIPSSALTSPASSPLSPLSPLPKATLAPRPNSETLKLMLEQGVELYERGEYAASLEIISDLLAYNSSDFLAYNVRGNVYTALGDYENALGDYSRSIEIQPFFPHAYYNRGRINSFLDRYDEALSDLQESIELDPVSFGYRANGNIGLIYHKLGEYDKALEAFESSISYNKDEKADVYYFRGETYTALENYEAAIADYQAAIARFSRYNPAHQSLGYVYYKNGQFDEAFNALNQALEISPNSPITHFYLALVYLATDETDSAKAEVSQAMDSITTLSEEEQDFIAARVLADLETFAQDNPDQAEEVKSIINLIPEPR